MAEDCEATACCASIIDELDRVCGELDGIEAASIAALQPLVDIVNDPAGIFVGTPGGDLPTVTELVNRINNFAGGFDEWVFTETRPGTLAPITLPAAVSDPTKAAVRINGARVSSPADYSIADSTLTLVDSLEVGDQITVKTYGA